MRGSSFWFFIGLMLVLGGCAATAPDTGVRVVLAELWGAGHAAGIRAGDLLVAWSRGGEGGPIRSPLDIELLIVDHSPRGEVEISYRRDGREDQTKLRHGDWALKTAPLEGDESQATAMWGRLERARDLQASGESEEASRLFAEARAQLTDPRLVDMALNLEIRAREDNASGDLAATIAAYGDAIERIRVRAPGSPLLAWYLDGVGWARHRHFDDRAEASLREALAIYEALPNAEVERSLVLNHLANHELRRGAYETAGELYREAYRVRAQVAPNAPRNGALLGNLGLAQRRQGRLDEAERTGLEALNEISKLDPRGLNAGYSLRNLGLLALDKGDYDAAEGYYKRALSIFEEVRPDNLQVAGMMLNLGNIAKNRGKLVEAERRYRTALELWSSLEYDPVVFAKGQHNLGDVLREQGRFEEARARLEEALSIKEQHVPSTPLVGTTLFSLGMLLGQQGDLDRAEALHQRALAIRRAVIPDTAEAAESLFALARVADDRGQLVLAQSRRLEAVAILEGQRDRLVFDARERSRFSARFHEEYRALAEFFVDTERVEQAFEFLESSRGRSLRALMSQREIGRSAVRELVSERKRAEQRLARVRSRLASVAVEDNDGFQTAQAELRELRARIDDVRERMGRAVPAISVENDLRQFSASRVREQLDADTKLLSYSVGPDRTLVFIVSSDGADESGVQVREIAIEREVVAALVERFLAFVERGRETDEVEPALLRLAHELYRALWAPLEEDLRGVTRAVVVAEGPLLALPFGALVESIEPRIFLAERIALTFTTSATVLRCTDTGVAAPAPGPLGVGRPQRLGGNRAATVRP